MNIYLRKKMDLWLKEKVIDIETYSKIIDYEKSNFRLSGSHFVLGLGVVAIAVGIISVIAANWYNISKETKILLNIIFLILLASQTYFSFKKNYKYLLEIFSTLYFFSIIATFALFGQVYNVTNDIFITLSYWLLLGTPLIMLTKTKYVAYFYSALILGWAIAGVRYFSHTLTSSYSMFVLIPIVVFYFSLLFKILGKNEISESLKNLARFSLSILFMIVAPLLWRVDQNFPIEASKAIVSIFVSVPIFFYLFKKFSMHWTLVALLIYFYIQIPVILSIGDQKELSAIFFILIWLSIGYLSYEDKNKKLFDISFVVISLRIIVIYFEVFGSLLNTGIGLIATGCFLMIAFYLWNAYRKTIWQKMLKGKE
ncbi:DUF2157 domain-containing protein [Bacteriovorax stolpii]|uniref:DUF2157 domain-containing protein n=1 Tax=Bacteriovorax stolpii TaxID=960 RepID=UPI00163BABC4|nr:DUF2157 domain-containing protein [Bacteriovorax stolpii]